MRRVLFHACALAVIVAAWSMAGRSDPAPPSAPPSGSMEAVAIPPTASADIHERELRPGFPLMNAGRQDRGWRAMVAREIDVSAAQLGGRAWNDSSREQFVVALRRLRDAGARRDRARNEPDSVAGIAAARRQRVAALGADAMSRELFGVPLAVFLQRADQGAIEEVPAG